MRTLSCVSLIALLPLFFTNCTVGPDFEPPSIATPSSFSKNSQAKLPETNNWLELLGNTQLTSLIEKARRHNPSLEALHQRMLQSQVIINRNKAENFPQLSGSLEYTRQKNSDATLFSSSGAFSNYSSGLNAGWEIDLFGRVRRLIEGAEADLGAAESAYLDLLLYTETEVAISYFRLQRIEQEIIIIQRSVESRKESLQVIDERFTSGIVSDLDVSLAETLLAEAEADLAALQRSKEVQQHALAVLLGEPASDFHCEIKNEEIVPPPLIPVNLPSELLKKRPDLRQSLYALRKANANIGVATANFYPRISLGGGIGFSSFDANNWFESNSNFYNFGPSLSLPLFQGGQLRSELKRSEYAYAEAFASYKQTVIEAFAEVENALSGCYYLEVQRQARERANTSAQRAKQIANEQYLNGIIDYTSVLETERTALNTERLLTQTLGNQKENSILLIRAIGGSWE